MSLVTREASQQNLVTLESTYSKFSKRSRDIGSQIASNVNMLQLGDANQGVADAVLQIEALTNKGQEASGFMAKMPLLGKYFAKASKHMDEQELKSGSITKVVDRLFTSLSDKKDNIMDVMDALFSLKEQLANEIEEMEQQETMATQLIQDLDGYGKVKAKNLLVQVSQSIIKAKDRVGIIDATCKSAEASTMAISSMLPMLEGELITEMAIQGGLQELKEFKQVFDQTIGLVNDLSHTNNANMVSVLEDVIDLSVARPTDIALLESNSKSREETQARLKKKMDNALDEQNRNIAKLTEIRSSQLILGYQPDDPADDSKTIRQSRTY